MKNTIFFDSNFNFTLLENEENPENSIYIKFHTSDAANQVLNILANASTSTESLASDTDIVYELEQTNWTNNGATVIWLTNDNITSPKVKIIFSEIPTVSCAINRGTNTVFLMQYEGQDEEESGGGSGGGSGSGGFDFVEIIRNIGFRLLDEPSNVSAEYNELTNVVEIKWTDPADIVTNEPAPAEWAGTVVVRKSGSAPLHKWDGTIIVDSTTRDEYSVNPLIDNNIDASATYYYGIFPYDTKGDYRYTKVVTAYAAEIPAPQIDNLFVNRVAITVNYAVSSDFSYDFITLVYKKNSEPADKTDGTIVSLSAGVSSIKFVPLEETTTYYFKIFVQVQGTSEEIESNVMSATTGNVKVVVLDFADMIMTPDVSHYKYFNAWNPTTQYIDTDYNLLLLPNQSGDGSDWAQPQSGYDVAYRGAADVFEQYYYFKLKKRYILRKVSMELQALEYSTINYRLLAGGAYAVEPNLTRYNEYLISKPGNTAALPVRLPLSASDTDWHSFETTYNDLEILYLGFYATSGNINWRNIKAETVIYED